MRYVLLGMSMFTLLAGCGWFDSSTPANTAKVRPGAERQVASSSSLPAPSGGRQYEPGIAAVDETRSGSKIGAIVPDKGGQKKQLEEAAKESADVTKKAREARRKAAQEAAERKARSHPTPRSEAADGGLGAAARAGDDHAGSATDRAKRRSAAAHPAKRSPATASSASGSTTCSVSDNATTSAAGRACAGACGRCDAAGATGRSQQGLHATCGMGAAGSERAGRRADHGGERDVAAGVNARANGGPDGHSTAAAGTVTPRACGAKGSCVYISAAGAGPDSCRRSAASGRSQQSVRAATGVGATGSSDADQRTGRADARPTGSTTGSSDADQHIGREYARPTSITTATSRGDDYPADGTPICACGS